MPAFEAQQQRGVAATENTVAQRQRYLLFAFAEKPLQTPAVEQ